MNTELIVALDVKTTRDAITIIKSLPEKVGFYKIGLELFCAEGPGVVEAVKACNKKVFLDLKLHDIPRTVAHAVKQVGNLGANLLTIHAIGGSTMMQAAAEAAAEFGDDAPDVIAVTTLTSLNLDDFKQLGIERTLQDQAFALSQLAMSAGIQGVVTSVHEASILRLKLGNDFLLVTPGIRLASDDVGDQKRVATPAAAVNAGANYIVVGRPIVQADNPSEAALKILGEMRAIEEA